MERKRHKLSGRTYPEAAQQPKDQKVAGGERRLRYGRDKFIRGITGRVRQG